MGGCLRWPEVVLGFVSSNLFAYKARASLLEGAGCQRPLAQKPPAPLCLAEAVLQQQRKRGLAAHAAGWDPVPSPAALGSPGQMCLRDVWLFLPGCMGMCMGDEAEQEAGSIGKVNKNVKQREG